MKKVRIGIVGSGFIAELHMHAYRRVFGVEVEVRAVVSRGEGAAAFAQRFGIPQSHRDWRVLLDDAEIDVVDICTPPALHAEMIVACMGAGKHVICEKPLFGSVAEVDEMAALVERAGVRFMPVFQYRYGMGIRKLLHLLGRGLAGRPVLTTVETHWWRPPAYFEVEWRGRWATELGGGFLGHAVHAHDMLTLVHGEPASVFAHGATLLNRIEVEETMTASVRMANGSLAALSMTLGSRSEISRLRFCFENLVAESILEPYTMGRDPWRFECGDEGTQRTVDAALAEVQPAEDGYTRQFELFHAALETGSELPVTLADARRSLELVTAAYYSAQMGREGVLPIRPDHPFYRSWAPRADRAA